MKSPFFAALLVCGCLASFRAQAISYEYDWVGESPSASYSGSIFLDASSNPVAGGTVSDILSYNITANGINFTGITGGNSSIASVGAFFYWDPTMIDTMDLTITNHAGTVLLSVTDGTISGTGITQVSGEWDAPSTSVPDAAGTLSLFAIALTALGWYSYNLRRQQMAVARKRVVVIKRQAGMRD